MKLISLNTWCGRAYEPLMEFIKSHSEYIDIFCFQEIRNGKYLVQTQEDLERTNLFNEIQIILPNFKGYFTEMVQGVGIATFIRNTIQVESINSAQILSSKDMEHIKMADGGSYYPRVMQSISTKNFTVHNFHGIPGNQKKDTLERELQTKRLMDILNKEGTRQIIVGDFNLDIKTDAISILENKMRNLIKEGSFKTTRNDNYKEKSVMPFADYIFISNEVRVQDFKVLSDEVSDHLPLFLDFI